MAGSDLLMNSQEAREAMAADDDYEDEVEEGEHSRSAGPAYVARQSTMESLSFDDDGGAPVAVGTQLPGGARIGVNPAFRQAGDGDEGDGSNSRPGSKSPAADPAAAAASSSALALPESQEIGGFSDDDEEDEDSDEEYDETIDEWADDKTSKQIYDKLLVKKKQLAEHNRSKDLVVQVMKDFAQANKVCA